MSTEKRNEKGYKREIARGMLKSAFASLFWGAIAEKRRVLGSYPMQRLADGLEVDKSTVSRWFSSEGHNWELESVADIADELDLDLRIEAVDRSTGTVITPSGVRARVLAQKADQPPATTADNSNKHNELKPRFSSIAADDLDVHVLVGAGD